MGLAIRADGCLERPSTGEQEHLLCMARGVRHSHVAICSRGTLPRDLIKDENSRTDKTMTFSHRAAVLMPPPFTLHHDNYHYQYFNNTNGL